MSWTSDCRKKWQALIRHIKQQFPRYKIAIHRKKSSLFYGLVRQEEDRKVKIIIDKDLPFDLAVYTLAEEVAHLKRGIKKTFEKNHDDRWGQLYAFYLREFTNFLKLYEDQKHRHS